MCDFQVIDVGCIVKMSKYKTKKNRKFIIVQGPMSHMSHLTEVLASSQVFFFYQKTVMISGIPGTH